jgi:uncharacterized protein YwgA
MLEVDDIIVLLLGAPTNNQALVNQIKGITRLEKLIFLIERETSLNTLIDEDADFKPYNYGPFSDVVYRSVGYLSAYGLVNDTGVIEDSTDDSWEQRAVIGVEYVDPYATRDFSLTDRGKQYYKTLVREVADSKLKELSDFKARLGSIPLRQLVRYVYLRYPEMTKRSIILDEVIGSG